MSCASQPFWMSPELTGTNRLPGGTVRRSCALCPWAAADGDPGLRARALAAVLVPATGGR